MAAGTVLGILIFCSVLAGVFFASTRVLDALNGSGSRKPRVPQGGTMADQEWTVKDLTEALKVPIRCQCLLRHGAKRARNHRKGTIRQDLGRLRGNGSSAGPIDSVARC